jgi:hypothetical protein
MPLDAASLVMHRAFLVLGTYSEIGPVQRDLLKVSFSPDSGHVADIPAGPSSAINGSQRQSRPAGPVRENSIGSEWWNRDDTAAGVT